MNHPEDNSVVVMDNASYSEKFTANYSLEISYHCRKYLIYSLQ